MASTHPSEVFEEAVLDYKVDHLYALFSGGHDSLTAASLASKHELFRGVVHLNTGIGIEETREFVRDVCRSQGWPLFEQYAGLTRYEDLVLERGGFPYGAQSHNSMLFYLKQQPLRRWFATTKGRIGLVTGIRKQESVRRMGVGISVPVRWRDKEPRNVWISPILEWSKIDCGRYMEVEKLSRNRVVDLLHRSGECLCGALARAGEIHELARWFPDVAQRINRLEKECERRGIMSSVWASREARNLSEGQEQLFSKADLAPLCVSCESSHDATKD